MSFGSIRPPLLEPIEPSIGIRANLRVQFLKGLEEKFLVHLMEFETKFINKILFKGEKYDPWKEKSINFLNYMNENLLIIIKEGIRALWWKPNQSQSPQNKES